MTIHDIGTDPLSPAMTITTDQVVQWAREVWTCGPLYIGPSEGSLTEFASLAHEVGRRAGLEEAAATCADFNTIEGIAQQCAVAIRERIKA